MKPFQKTTAFLSLADAATRREVLNSIAHNYGITAEEALAEVTDPEAEHLLDYLTGPVRSAVSVLMQRRALA